MFDHRGADQFLTSFDVSEDTGSVLTAALPRMSAGAGAKKAKFDHHCVSNFSAGILSPQTRTQVLSAINFVNNPFIRDSYASETIFNGGLMATASTSVDTIISQRPSKVVHLRNIPSDMTELELIQFCMPYGKLMNYLILKGKNQAFVEYEEQQGAQALVAFSLAFPVAIRDRTIFCQFSNHQELKTEKRSLVPQNEFDTDTEVGYSVLMFLFSASNSP
ncbi:unnamed protein product [Dracunculus medinensis]|uniref:RRM domain-containing protein n=1 Tax=Dracunculus medinensis TaxID=318479 RepID=A0A0N4UBJ2_DRAME|nr:unnamed protein product [Dracunculus medinensis]